MPEGGINDGSIGHEPALLIWPRTFELIIDDGAVEIVDATGRVVVRMEDDVQFTAFDVAYDQAIRH